jgi:hypothetical protein
LVFGSLVRQSVDENQSVEVASTSNRKWKMRRKDRETELSCHFSIFSSSFFLPGTTTVVTTYYTYTIQCLHWPRILQVACLYYAHPG